MNSLAVTLSALGLLLASLAAAAETPAVIASYDDTTLSAAELAADVAALPEAQRQRFRDSPVSRRRLVADLLVRRQVAARARAEGLADDPAIRHRLRLLEERLLYQAYMKRAEAGALDEPTIERLARDEYRAFRDKFRAPEAVRARHILLRTDAEAAPGRDVTQTATLARELLERVRAGEDFAALARQYSEDPGSRAKGGDLGYFERDRMVKPFADAAFALREPGQLSDIVETPFGLHIIQLVERRAAGLKSFAEVREELMQSNRNQVRKRVRLEIVEPLRDPQRMTIDEAALEAVFAAE